MDKLNDLNLLTLKDVKGFKHKLKWLKRLPRHILYRLKYGVAPSDVWNFDYSLAVYIINGINTFKNDKTCGNSRPAWCTEEEWDRILDDVIEKWDILRNRDDILFELLDEGYDSEYISEYLRGVERDAFKALQKVYFDLWD